MVSELVCVEIGTALGVDQYAIDACLHNNQRDITFAGYTILRKWFVMQKNSHSLEGTSSCTKTM